MTKKEYIFRIEYEVDKKTGRVTATIPELNHVSSFGDTFAEAEANVREAALCYLETLQKEKMPIPKPVFKTEGTYIKLFGMQKTSTKS
jgi:predicted RNase H-like HicB family nuclease